jgi:excinuclease ABC subunit B
MGDFHLISKLRPAGDQSQAIKYLVKNLKDGIRHQVLLGVTGSGKTFTMASVIAKVQKPVLIISHNKTLAAQTYQEFKEFFPENAVHYFVSYYDYYQPEAYIPQSDTYIEKDAKINEELDRMRHAATQDLINRNDVIVVASVSSIYNIGSPEDYQKVSLEIIPGQKIKRKDFLRNLLSLQYQRNDADFKPGTFRVRGEIVEIYLVTGTEVLRIEFFGDQISRISTNSATNISEISGKFVRIREFKLFPAHFWVTPQDRIEIAMENIKLELEEQIKYFKKEKKLLEAQKIEQRTNFDLEMIKESGYCHGIENYSRHLEFRKPGDPPFTLIDYFKYIPNKHESTFANISESQIRENSRDFLLFIDESHQTLSQLHAMANQDRARKKTLIEYGFRLPSAIDNRPLTFQEFEEKINPARLNFSENSEFSLKRKKAKNFGGQVVYVSATPGKEEIEKALRQNQIKVGKKPSTRAKLGAGPVPHRNKVSGAGYIVEQLIRPTGLLEPSIEIRSTKNQVKDLISETKERVEKKERVLVLTLTKRLAEALADYLNEEGISCQWLHSEVKTLERPQILKDLRLGKYDVLVGINLLREGLDLPEVALVAILDADKEGFLRSETTLIQTMGRAARHLNGHVILYADKVTKSMAAAIKEVNRRRKIQEKYNRDHNITPSQIIKKIRDWPFMKKEKEISFEFWAIRDKKLLEKEMKEAARNLDFERAAEIRDLIKGINNKN